MNLENYKQIVQAIKTLSESSEDVKRYLSLTEEKNLAEANVKSMARDYGSYSDELLDIKVSMPQIKYSAKYQVVQELASDKEWELISRSAMDYEIHGGKLKTLIDDGLVSKKLAKAIEEIKPTPAVTIRLK